MWRTTRRAGLGLATWAPAAGFGPSPQTRAAGLLIGFSQALRSRFHVQLETGAETSGDVATYVVRDDQKMERFVAPDMMARLQAAGAKLGARIIEIQGDVAIAAKDLIRLGQVSLEVTQRVATGQTVVAFMDAGTALIDRQTVVQFKTARHD